MIIEKYTLIFSAGIILPAILAMVAKLVTGMNFELLSELELGLEKETREALFGAAMTAIPLYLGEYSLLASAFVAFEEGRPKKTLLYALLLLPLSLIVYFVIKA